MSHPNVVQDKRRASRADARLQIELVLEGSMNSLTTSTVNISANGMYFNSEHYIEPLTKLGFTLYLPGEFADEEPEALDVQGVVVRTMPEKESADADSYEIACYFTDASPEFRARLERYVQEEF